MGWESCRQRHLLPAKTFSLRLNPIEHSQYSANSYMFGVPYQYYIYPVYHPCFSPSKMANPTPLLSSSACFLLLFTITFLHGLPLPINADEATDVEALISFKKSISRNPLKALVDWTNITHHCNWSGIACDSLNNVVSISLPEKQLYGVISSFLANISSLDSLDLTSNSFHGSIPPQLALCLNLTNLALYDNALTGTIPDSLGALVQLQSLDLAKNFLEGSIPESICNCTSLTAVSFSNNNLTGAIPANIGNLLKLQLFDAYTNDLTGSIPRSFGKCHDLEALDLSENRLDGSIPTELGNMYSLQYLNLFDNALSGSIPSSLSSCKNLVQIALYKNNISGTIPGDFGKLAKLEVLLLYQNSLYGTIPAALSLCKSLTRLVLSNNQLTGNIPYELGSLASLENLSLFLNRLTGVIPASLGNCLNLTTLALYSNNLTGPIPQSLVSLEKLQHLLIANNELSGSIPTSLSNCSSLVRISFTYNQLTGQIPSDLDKLSMIRYISFGYNQLSGRIPSATYNCSLLLILDFAGNRLTGPLQGIGKLRNLQRLLLFLNSFSGAIPMEIGNLTNLISLELGGNNFSGSIPASLGLLTQLQGLYLQKNFLDEGIPEELSGCVQLSELELQLNRLTGAIPEALSKLHWLTSLYLYGNMLNGSIPSSLGKCTRLQDLDISHNQLIGSIPTSVASLKEFHINFNMSNNFLTGSIPTELGGMQMVQVIDLSNNNLSGTIPSSLGECSSLQGLDLSKNGLQGNIPVSLSRLLSLEFFLNLSHNQLGGEIPEELNSLKLLMSLDFSSNRLTGSIPSKLGNLTMLKYLNLSDNQLEGPIPQVGILRNFNLSSFEGNTDLCGSLNHLRPCSTVGESGSHHHRLRRSIVIVISVLAGITILTALISTAFILRFKNAKKNIKPEDSMKVPAEHLTRFTQRDLENATDSFNPNNIIGSSSISTVYKGVLNNGRTVAIKKMSLQTSKELDRCFNTELHTLARIRHRNLVKVLGFAWDNRIKAIVLDFMPNGNLDALLHDVDQGGCQLGFAERLQICISVAQGLVYLHEEYGIPIVHCDLKPANILLDEDLEAHVTDFGTARMLGVHLEDESGRSSSVFQGTIGYFAPEFAYMSRVTPKADVFSFGIILMEILTNRRPTSNLLGGSSEGGVSTLQEWIENAVRSGLSGALGVVNSSLLVNSSREDEEKILGLLKISLLCTKPVPENRPSMSAVLSWLSSVKQNRMNGRRSIEAEDWLLTEQY